MGSVGKDWTHAQVRAHTPTGTRVYMRAHTLPAITLQSPQEITLRQVKTEKMRHCSEAGRPGWTSRTLRAARSSGKRL